MPRTQIHHPYALNRSDPPKPIGYDPDRILGVWRELEQLVNEKKLRNIGISNFTASKLEKLKPHAKVPIAVNQVRQAALGANPNETLGYTCGCTRWSCTLTLPSLIY